MPPPRLSQLSPPPLPLPDPAAAGTGSPAQQRGIGQGVLLADGDAELLSVMAGQLRQEGIPLRMAATGRQAVRLALQQAPALLVLEAELPDGNGFEVVGALRRHPSLEATPLLVYTGLDLSEEQCRRLRLGPTRYLSKSATTDAQFKEAVVHLLRQTTRAAASSGRQEKAR